MKHHRKNRTANACALAALLCVFAAGAGAQVRQTEKRQEVTTRRQQAAQKLKVGKFTGKSPPEIEASGQKRLVWRPLGLAELMKVAPGMEAALPYADLSAGNLKKPGRAYIDLVFDSTHSGASGGVFVPSNTVSFLGLKGRVRLNVKRSAPGKVYLADCAVSGFGVPTEFTVEGGGHTETWPNVPHGEIHIVLTIIPADDEWYQAKITNNTDGAWSFLGCRIMEY